MSVVKPFNTHLMEFVDEISEVFPKDREIKLGRIALKTIKKVNPSLLIRYWYQYIYLPYKEKINEGDIEFFIEKDYSQDVQLFDDPGYFMKAIDKFRGPIREMDNENKEKALKYVQNLCQMSVMYHDSKTK
tara:strand:+ start:141 stop:533 length:393 start_codon:yes stop_codon:yes gene_type:complete